MFKFKNELDEEIAHIDVAGVSGSQLCNHQQAIIVDMYHSKSVSIVLESAKHRSYEYLRFLTAIQTEYDKRQDADNLLDGIMIRSIGGNDLQ
jgi:hypothetical protein